MLKKFDSDLWFVFSIAKIFDHDVNRDDASESRAESGDELKENRCGFQARHNARSGPNEAEKPFRRYGPVGYLLDHQFIFHRSKFIPCMP
jgi:hypothetical protein